MSKILVIKPSSLGDILHGLVVAQSIREQLPGCSITWVVGEQFAPVVQGCPTVDHTLIFERRGGVRALIHLGRALRRDYYDYALDFQGLARSGLMLLMARARTKIGRSDAREGAGWAARLKAPLPPPGKNPHAIEILLQFLPLLGLEASLRSPIRLQAEPLAPPHDRLPAMRPVVLALNSRDASKEWPGFVELTRLLLERHPDLPVVWGSHKPWPTPAAFAAHPQFHNLTARTTLEQMIGLIESARLVVANDSGLMHVAAAVGAPLVACFGPTLPEATGPYPLDRPTHRILCAPRGDLSRLEVTTVYEAVAGALKVAPQA